MKAYWVPVMACMFAACAANTRQFDESEGGEQGGEGGTSGEVNAGSSNSPGEDGANDPEGASGEGGAAGCEGSPCALNANGARCAASRECLSGVCVAGVCCSKKCDGACQTCVAAGLEGTCTLAIGAPPIGKSCPGEGACRGSCDGASETCVFPGPDVACEEASCSNASGVARKASYCDGAGTCAAAAQITCGEYACNGDDCRIDCLHDGDCRDGAVCVSAAYCIVYQQKRIDLTEKRYVPSGVSGADEACQTEFGADGGTWKALIVGGGRIATLAPYRGTGRADWVIGKFTEYYNRSGRLIWTTEDIPLLGVRDGGRVDLAYPAFADEYGYPWAGYEEDWTTDSEQNCDGWSSRSQSGGGFAYSSLLPTGALELCSSAQRYVCVEQ